MSKRNKERKPPAPTRFKVGNQVRVKRGVVDSEYPEMPLGAGLATVFEIEEDSYLVRWSGATLEAVHPGYRKRCERDGVDFGGIWRQAEELEPDPGEPLSIEQPTNIAEELPSLDEQEDRIKAEFGLRSDDPLPDLDRDSLRSYYKYLPAHSTFPFDAEYSGETGPADNTSFAVTVVGLLDAGKYPDS